MILYDTVKLYVRFNLVCNRKKRAVSLDSRTIVVYNLAALKIPR
jgi:hypothetical protein